MKSLGQPELDLLLLASREESDQALRSRIQSCLPACSDSEFFVGTCLAHKTFPLVYQSLLSAGVSENSEFTARICADLRRKCLTFWYPKRKRLLELSAEVGTLFKASGISFAVLRGLPFAERFYRRPELRVCQDIDLLVRVEHKDKAEQTLLASGFCHNEDPLLRQARAVYMGQVEMVHIDTGVIIDLNWRLTGNAGIGDVSVDMDRIWSSARSLSGGLCELSPEDTLVDAVRHCGHGHDFLDGLVRCCTDVSAILGSSSSRFDWEYVQYQLAKSESQTVFGFFAEFYDSFFRTPGSEPLARRILSHSERMRRVESRAFCRAVMIPAISSGSRALSPLGEVLVRYKEAVSKFWALDKLRRLWSLTRMLVFPSEVELTMLENTFDISPRSWLRRPQLYGLLLIVAPALLLGSLLRLLVVPLRSGNPNLEGNRRAVKPGESEL